MSSNGYYVVNGKAYFNKLEAILDAQKTSAKVSWNFHQDIFEKVNWQVEPEPSLDDFYRMRAQQIRDKYDYVIVRVSGGADSTNVIKSFLNNGIRVDEIIADVPLSGLNNWEYTKSTSSANTVSESKYVQFPLLNEIKTSHPDIKISINDYFEYISTMSAEEWVSTFGDWINPHIHQRLHNFNHLRNLVEQGKRIGIVWGIDKPQLRYTVERNLIVTIVDRVVNIASKDPFNVHYPNIDNVLFYYTHELPELMVKQCHVLAKYIHMKENRYIAEYVRALSRARVASNTLNDMEVPIPEYVPKTEYQRAIAPIIYPTTWTDVFQCDKGDGTFMSSHNGWFFQLHKNTKYYDMMKSEFVSFYKSLNHNYLSPNKDGLLIFSQKYTLGNISKWLK